MDGSMPLPAALPAELVTIAASRREPVLRPALSLAAELVEMSAVAQQDRDRLVETLDVLETETADGSQAESGLRTDTLTLVRASCVRLADALAKSGYDAPPIKRWLIAAPLDPIPEVRFALEVDED
jgi:hypothetical protein